MTSGLTRNSVANAAERSGEIRARQIARQYPASGAAATRRGKAVLVVFKQHAPCICVANYQIQHCAACVVDQRLIAQRARKKFQRLPRLRQPTLCEPFLIERVAFD